MNVRKAIARFDHWCYEDNWLQPWTFTLGPLIVELFDWLSEEKQ